MHGVLCSTPAVFKSIAWKKGDPIPYQKHAPSLWGRQRSRQLGTRGRWRQPTIGQPSLSLAVPMSVAANGQVFPKVPRHKTHNSFDEPCLVQPPTRMLDQFNHSSALLKPVRRVQFGVFSPEDIVRFRAAAANAAGRLGGCLGVRCWGEGCVRPPFFLFFGQRERGERKSRD